MIIGLSGYAQSGKDTLGAVLVSNYGFTRFAFADALKEVVYRLNPFIQWEILVDSAGPYTKHQRVQDVVDAHGWEMAKRIPEVRRLLQVMGTEAGRQVLGDNIWVDTVLNQINGRDAVITDCRFPNEAEAVKARGGYVVRVTRPGVEAVNAHPSETALDDYPFDCIVNNNGSLSYLEIVVSNMYNFVKTDIGGCTPQDVLL
jgi:hypothetical protein